MVPDSSIIAPAEGGKRAGLKRILAIGKVQRLVCAEYVLAVAGNGLQRASMGVEKIAMVVGHHLDHTGIQHVVIYRESDRLPTGYERRG